MNTYRDDARRVSREYYWTIPRVAAAIAIGTVLMGVAAGVASTLLFPTRIINRVLDPDRAISRYEFFHDAHNQIRARVAQIKGHRDLMKQTMREDEGIRLRIELAAMQQTCRDLAARYNADASKTHVDIFRGRTAPASIDTGVCE